MDSLNLNLKKYDRVFTFGCSFTQYLWATWADIIGLEIGSEKLFNYGRAGAGNFFICNAVLEADHFYKLTPNDLVMVMFTNTSREDRLVGKNWITCGNIYTQNMLDRGFMKYWDDDHGFLRDLSVIKMLKGFLQNKNVDFHLMSMVPIGRAMGGENLDFSEQLINYSSDIVKDIKPSILEVVFKNNWHSIQPRSITRNPDVTHPVFGKGWYEDNHAHPNDYLKYLQLLWPETEFSPATINQVNIWHQEVIDTKERKSFIPYKCPSRLFY